MQWERERRRSDVHPSHLHAMAVPSFCRQETDLAEEGDGIHFAWQRAIDFGEHYLMDGAFLMMHFIAVAWDRKPCWSIDWLFNIMKLWLDCNWQTWLSLYWTSDIPEKTQSLHITHWSFLDHDIHEIQKSLVSPLEALKLQGSPKTAVIVNHRLSCLYVEQSENPLAWC